MLRAYRRSHLPLEVAQRPASWWVTLRTGRFLSGSTLGSIWPRKELEDINRSLVRWWEHRRVRRKIHQILTVTKQTGTSPLVQSHQTQVLDNPDRRSAWGIFDRLGDLSLNLKTDLYNLERICENLVMSSV